jgi:hypothetical protein
MNHTWLFQKRLSDHALANHAAVPVIPEGVAGFSGTEEQLAVDGGFLRGCVKSKFR